MTNTTTVEDVIDNFCHRASSHEGLNIRQTAKWKFNRLITMETQPFEVNGKVAYLDPFREAGYQIHGVGFTYSRDTNEIDSSSVEKALNVIESICGKKNVWGYFTTQEYVKGSENENRLSVCYFFLNKGHPDDIWKALNPSK